MVGFPNSDHMQIIMIMIVIQGWGREACTPVQLHTHSNTQTKFATLIIITLSTLTMKHKSEVIK